MQSRRASGRVSACLLVFGVCGWCAAPDARATITLGQVDTFQDGTTMGWQEGPLSPNPPTNVATGGPAGAGDRYLQNVATGPPEQAGSKQIVFNFSQWAGDYVTAGVDVINAMMANFGADPLPMRLAFQGGLGTQFGSTSAVVLPADGQWHPVSFDLSAMSLIIGGDSLATVMSSVTEVRLMASTTPAWRPDDLESTLGVDNLTAAPEPGALALLGLGALALRRRHR